ncbi:hypothetical protein ACG0Z3_07550 [Roseateles sp. LKC17W]|uniref:Uncharacterized protein n=1 Tax=Pelomonas margarita TaxID=3299031 RepID=A0ABW7FFP6_9BURK
MDVKNRCDLHRKRITHVAVARLSYQRAADAQKLTQLPIAHALIAKLCLGSGDVVGRPEHQHSFWFSRSLVICCKFDYARNESLQDGRAN